MNSNSSDVSLGYSGWNSWVSWICAFIFLINFTIFQSLFLWTFFFDTNYTHIHTHMYTHKHTYILDYMLLSDRSLRHSSFFTPVFCLSGLHCGQFQLPCFNGHWYCFFHLIYSFSKIFILGIFLTSKSFIFLFPLLFSLL